jgi:hypothetical protein
VSKSPLFAFRYFSLAATYVNIAGDERNPIDSG